MALFADSDIASGSELTYDYRFASFGQSRRMIKFYYLEKCYCGAVSCNGFIGKPMLKPEEPLSEEIQSISNMLIFSGTCSAKASKYK